LIADCSCVALHAAALVQNALLTTTVDHVTIVD
jgi:hypothetical protein